MYAAYYNGRQLFHFGVNGSHIHPAIQVWTKRFLPPSAVISHAKERSAGDPRSLMKRRTMSNEPSPQEQETLRQVAASIWHPWIVNYWDMNAAVGNILATVTGEILKCSIAYSFVPQQILNPFTKPQLQHAWKLVRKYFNQIIRENYKISQNQRYQSCIYVAAANWRSPIEMASAGI
ncbi:hypothetical protein ADT28_03515 [Xylella fastidiosa]|nr:hypothetical protein OY18_05470 [Xylella fastidiosa]OCA58400.1 hypothetical protein AA93_05230 [Xylella fastidiosa subsp. pauca 11399]KXB13346.1 hypothetical protein ADT29_08180 [Xylella fastidiosa]KXB22125.1 hypothetical protein ADT28_03515 [Xylella fastidiosa]NRP54028.1 hypothetical protein [Xylella fastidiosa]